MRSDSTADRLQHETTGSAGSGVPIGLVQLSELHDGLHLLGGSPGLGKTALALQSTAAATTDVPVVVVTFEHAPANLALKLLYARAHVNLRDVQRGYADLVKLRRVAEVWKPVAQWLAVIEGSCRLTVAQVRAQAWRGAFEQRG